VYLDVEVLLQLEDDQLRVGNLSPIQLDEWHEAVLGTQAKR
jgi:hypothetical protein